MRKDLVKKAEQLKLKANIVGESLYIYSDIGYTQEWYLTEERDKLILKHKNTRGTKKDKRHFHIQKVYKDTSNSSYIKAFQHIVAHDRYKMVKDVKNRKMELFAMISNNSIPKVKFN